MNRSVGCVKGWTYKILEHNPPLEIAVYVGLLQSNHALGNATAGDMEWSCRRLKSQYEGITGESEGAENTTISLHLTMVVLSLSWVSGPPHKMELLCPYWDLYITFSYVKKEKKKKRKKE